MLLFTHPRKQQHSLFIWFILDNSDSHTQGRLVRQTSSTTVLSSTITHVCERQALPFAFVGAVLLLRDFTALPQHILLVCSFPEPAIYISCRTVAQAINRSSTLCSCAPVRFHRQLFDAWVAATALKGKAAGGQSLCRVRATSCGGTGEHHGQPVRRPRMPRARSSPHCTTVFLLDWLLLPLILKLSPLLPLVLLLLRSQPR